MGAQYSEGTKMGDNQQQQPRSDLDRLTEGKEGREILIVATWLRPTKLIGLIDLFLSLICCLVAEFLTSWIRPFKPEHNIWYMGLWKKCGLSGIMLEKYVKGHLSIEEVNDNIDKYVECQGAAHGDHSMYVNLTRFLFSFSFALCIVCFIVGIAAYANRERRVWYRTLGWSLLLLAIPTLVSLIVFPVVLWPGLWFWMGGIVFAHSGRCIVHPWSWA